MPERDEDSSPEEEEPDPADDSEPTPSPDAASSASAVTGTHLFTDLESSSALWLKRPTMKADHPRHDALLHEHCIRYGGEFIKSTGDGLHYFFASAPAAVTAAFHAQRALLKAFPFDAPLTLRVRMALHTGEAQPREGDYYGPTLNRAARLMSALHGGQIGISETTALLIRETELPEGVALRNLGEHRLRGLEEPERIYQVVHPDLPADFPPLRATGTIPHNLPRQLTRFIGRRQESERAKELLAGSPLLTILGSGGSGKTRLALEVAADVLNEYPDGVWFVDLAPLTDGALIPDTVAAALSLREQPGEPLLETLMRHLEKKHVLLILDNCEHLIELCATFAHLLLRRSSDATILATSREALDVPGETAWPLPPLAVPDAHEVKTAAQMADNEAVHLFVDRATSVSPAFVLSDANVRAVTGICRRLDGIPLAIELAAVWVNTLSVEQIETRLSDRFRLLRRRSGGSRATLPPRQQTLEAAIDWSYRLLKDDKERILLRRLSVFAGGCTLEAAEAVCADDNALPDCDVLDALDNLVRASLVVMDEGSSGGETRYRLLDTIRQYGLERLTEAQEATVIRARFCAHLRGFAETVEPSLYQAAPESGLRLLESEHGNLRAALDMAKDADLLCGLRMVGALFWFWRVRGYVGEGRRWLEEFISRCRDAGAAPEAILAKALKGVGILAWTAGDFPAAQRYLEESLTLYVRMKDMVAQASCLNNLGNVAGQQGKSREAREFFEEVARIYRLLNDEAHLAMVLGNLGALANEQEDLESAIRYLKEAKILKERTGDQHSLADTLHNLGEVACKGNQYNDARRFFRESLEIRCALGSRSGLPDTLLWVAILAHRMGDSEQSALLHGAVESVAIHLSSPLAPPQARHQEADTRALREELTLEAFSRHWEHGRALSVEQAISRALLWLDGDSAR